MQQIRLRPPLGLPDVCYSDGMELLWRKHRIGLVESLGLRPWGQSLSQCVKAIVGDSALNAPPTRWGLSSLKQFRPLIGPATWAGWRPASKRTIIHNYFNRAGYDPSNGYDVRVTNAVDYRGAQRTYNGHMGTDFVVPVGTRIVAPAAGRVFRVENLMQRGGLKVVIDHGEGMITIHNHLARTTVETGQRVDRGERIGLSGMSSVDGIIAFPWLPPHLHFTVLLDGVAVDPFAVDGEVAIWRHGNDPRPAERVANEPIVATAWDAAAVEAVWAACRSKTIAAEVAGIHSLEQRAQLLCYWLYFAGWSFSRHQPLAAPASPRKPHLDLPIHPEDCVGVAQ